MNHSKIVLNSLSNLGKKRPSNLFIRSLSSGGAGGSLQGKVVVITGASSGIGEELGQLYAKRGATVVLAARRADKLNDVVQRCIAEGAASNNVVALNCDVSKESDCKSLIDQAVAKFGGIDYLILNAGIGQSFFLEAMEPGVDITTFMDINYYGCVYPTLHALPHLHKTGGRIVVVSSVGGLIPFPRQTLYNATKYALVGFFDTLRLEISAKNTGVSITMVCPGFVKTEITAGGGLGRDGKPVGDKAKGAKGPSIPMITAAQCASEISAAADARKRIVLTPKWYGVLVFLRKLFPATVDAYLTKSFVPKPKSKSS